LLTTLSRNHAPATPIICRLTRTLVGLPRLDNLRLGPLSVAAIGLPDVSQISGAGADGWLQQPPDGGDLVQLLLVDHVTRKPLFGTTTTRFSLAKSSIASRTGVAETPNVAASDGAE
jgi:hypothetical protein